MAENPSNAEFEDDDYMAHISLFLPPNPSPKPSFSKPKPNPNKSKPQQHLTMSKKRKQHLEDELTKASLESPLPPSNVDFKILAMMGYTPGSALGNAGTGPAEPVGIDIQRSRAGVGVEEEKRRRESELRERERRSEETMVGEFGERQKLQWRSRRVFANYRKAEAALAQIENREECPKVENEEGEGNEEEEEQELVTTEEYESADALATNCPGLSEDDH